MGDSGAPPPKTAFTKVIGTTFAMLPTDDLLASISYAALPQLLAYHVAVSKGADIDQLRNLAKSVTVE